MVSEIKSERKKQRDRTSGEQSASESKNERKETERPDRWRAVKSLQTYQPYLCYLMPNEVFFQAVIWFQVTNDLIHS